MDDADLRHAKLDGALLNGASLVEADLQQTSFAGATLARANLTETCGWDANFSGANLSRANLTFADLREATLTGAKFDGATLIGLRLEGTRFVPRAREEDCQAPNPKRQPEQTIAIATPLAVRDRLQAWASAEGRSLENLVAHLVEACVRRPGFPCGRIRDWFAFGFRPRW